MKTVKLNYFKAFCKLLLIGILTSGCAQSNHSPKDKAAMAAPSVDIHTAVLSGDLEMVKQHIAAGTDINEKEPFNASTPLISAAVFGKTEIVKTLLDAGADTSLKNNDGATALHTAAFFCRVEIVQLLMDAKADKTLVNNYGATPREIVVGPFTDVKPIYEMLQQQLAPLGLQLDMDEVEKTRPIIAMMLQ